MAILINRLKNSIKIILFFILIFNVGYIWAINFKENIKHWQTHQGTNVYFYPTYSSPIIQFGLVFGSGHAADKNSGASILANTLDLYDNTLSKQEGITSKLKSNGATFNADINTSASVFTMTANLFEQEFTNAIDLFHSIIVTPIFTEKEFLRNKTQYLNKNKYRYSTPQEQYSRAIFETLFTGHPMGQYISPFDIEKIQKNDVIRYYKNYYVAKNATLLIVGNITLKKAKEVSEKILADLPAGHAAQPIKVFSQHTYQAKKIFIQDKTTQQTSIKFGEPGILSNDPDLLALKLGIDIFAGGSLDSRLRDIMINEHGYSYSTNCEIVDRPYIGYFDCETSVVNSKAPEALQLMLTTLHQFLRDGPSKAEVDRAKNNFKLTFYKNNSNQNILQSMVLISQGYHTWNYCDTYLNRVDNITAEQIKLALQKHIHLDRLTFIILGPKDIRYVIKPDLLKLDSQP